MTHPLERISLGTARIGNDYGIAVSDQMGVPDPRGALERAYELGIRRLDTAGAYGASELVIGETTSGREWCITTKVVSTSSRLGGQGLTDGVGVRRELEASLTRLRQNSVDTVLLHNPELLDSAAGKLLYRELLACRDEGLCTKIGLAAYIEPDVVEACRGYRFDVVQLPYNLVDRRLVDQGILSELSELGVEVRARSVFLQGLLLMGQARQTARFPESALLWEALAEWSRNVRITMHEACLRFALSQKQIAEIVVGVDSAYQVDGLVALASAPPLEVPQVPEVDVSVLDPRLWN